MTAAAAAFAHATGLRVQCRRLHHEYETDSGPVTVLRDVNLTIAAGESVGVLGPSGSGKSTLLSVIGGLLPATSGTIALGDVDISEMTQRQRQALRGAQISVIVQNPARNLLPYATAEENILFAQRSIPRKDRRQLPKPETLLRALDLTSLAGRRVARMSGGEQQRLCVALGTATSASLVLIDEPSSQLDNRNRDLVAHLLARLSNETGSTLIVVSHDPVLAEQLNRRLTMASGHLMEHHTHLETDVADRGTQQPTGAPTRACYTTTTPGPTMRPPTPTAVLSAEHLGYQRGGRVIISNFSFSARSGELIAVVGPSGSGKTSLLALLSGLELPDEGRVRFNGHDITTGVPDDFSVVLQGYGLLKVLTASENVELPLQARHRTPGFITEKSATLLAEVGLLDASDQLIDELSGGQQQRVALARAIATDPAVLLADEVTAELDGATKARILTLIRHQAERGAIVILATHDPDVARQCNRIVELST